MNVIDRAIEMVAPRYAFRRMQARAALTLTQDFLERHAERFTYDGSSAGRRAHGWYAPSTDANVELLEALVWLRNRSRELMRNNPYAVKAVEELVGNGVGTGIVPQAKSGDVAIDKIIDAEWPFFVEACDTPQRLDFYGMQSLVMRTMAESGESIVRFRPRLAQDNLRVPLQLQFLEADFLDHARTMGTINGHVMQGVQFDLLGRRVAYWIYTYHPGGMLILNLSFGTWIYTKAPAKDQNGNGTMAPHPSGVQAPVFVATDWEPFEVSAITVPADFSTQFLSAQAAGADAGRATSPKQETIVMEQTTQAGAEARTDQVVLDAARAEQLRAEGAAAERQRVNTIRTTFAPMLKHGITQELLDALINEGVTLETARVRVQDQLAVVAIGTAWFGRRTAAEHDGLVRHHQRFGGQVRRGYRQHRAVPRQPQELVERDARHVD